MATWGAAAGQDVSTPLWVRFGEPKVQRRWTILVRAILVIPQAVVVYFLTVAAEFVVVVAWFAALFTGRVPPSAAEFLRGVLRWQVRVAAYALLLHDRYPPFTLDPRSDHPVDLWVHTGRLNRWAVFFRFVLVVPAAIVAGVVMWGVGLVSFVVWVITLIKGRMPASLFQALSVVLRYHARYYGYLGLLTSWYPAQLMGDGDLPPAPRWPEVAPVAPTYGAVPPPAGYGTAPDPAGYGAGAYDPYGPSAGYGTSAGYVPSTGYGVAPVAPSSGAPQNLPPATPPVGAPQAVPSLDVPLRGSDLPPPPPPAHLPGSVPPPPTAPPPGRTPPTTTTTPVPPPTPAPTPPPAPGPLAASPWHLVLSKAARRIVVLLIVAGALGAVAYDVVYIVVIANGLGGIEARVARDQFQQDFDTLQAQARAFDRSGTACGGDVICRERAAATFAANLRDYEANLQLLVVPSSATAQLDAATSAARDAAAAAQVVANAGPDPAAYWALVQSTHARARTDAVAATSHALDQALARAAGAQPSTAGARTVAPLRLSSPLTTMAQTSSVDAYDAAFSTRRTPTAEVGASRGQRAPTASSSRVTSSAVMSR